MTGKEIMAQLESTLTAARVMNYEVVLSLDDEVVWFDNDSVVIAIRKVPSGFQLYSQGFGNKLFKTLSELEKTLIEWL